MFFNKSFSLSQTKINYTILCHLKIHIHFKNNNYFHQKRLSLTNSLSNIKSYLNNETIPTQSLHNDKNSTQLTWLLQTSYTHVHQSIV